ncbi:unnamed protein product [Parnassius apollo]|uniref:(apollo) hypothetical protein n=1 Tax=Parnassius apollo TaxID=110799 RepID=A0A8S3XZL7_PARAO|nr:unnamed protein product [Parnassius apollo]
MGVKVIIFSLLAVVICSAFPFERELTPNAHAIPEYVLNPNLWWETSYLYPNAYSNFNIPRSYNYTYQTPYFTIILMGDAVPGTKLSNQLINHMYKNEFL